MITAGGFMLRATPLAHPNAGRVLVDRSPAIQGDSSLETDYRLPHRENRTGDIPTTDYLSILPPQNVIAMNSQHGFLRNSLEFQESK